MEYPTKILRPRKKPGPMAADAPIDAERDLIDAALVLELTDIGALGSRIPEMQLFDRERHVARRLNLEEEIELATRVQASGDIDARNTLVMSNIGLVHLVANQFCRPPLRYEDLVQEGTMGLIRATETFEPERGIRFSTYSVYWIRAKVQRLIQHLDRDDLPNIPGAQVQIDEYGRKRTPRARKLSIERMVDQEDSRTLGDMLPSDTEDPEVMTLKFEKEKMVKDVLNSIVEDLGDERLREIIQWRLLADEPETLTRVGKRVHLSREGARLLESKMLKLARQRLQTLQKS